MKTSLYILINMNSVYWRKTIMIIFKLRDTIPFVRHYKYRRPPPPPPPQIIIRIQYCRKFLVLYKSCCPGSFFTNIFKSWCTFECSKWQACTPISFFNTSTILFIYLYEKHSLLYKLKPHCTSLARRNWTWLTGGYLYMYICKALIDICI